MSLLYLDGLFIKPASRILHFFLNLSIPRVYIKLAYTEGSDTLNALNCTVILVFIAMDTPNSLMTQLLIEAVFVSAS